MSFSFSCGREGPLGTYGPSLLSHPTRRRRGRKHGSAPAGGVSGALGASFISTTTSTGVDYRFLQRARVDDARLMSPRRPMGSPARRQAGGGGRHSAWLGPGTYNPSDRITARRPQTALMRRQGKRARRRPKSTPFAPGPGSYDPKHPRDTRPESKAGLYTRERFPDAAPGAIANDDAELATPGVGQYDVKYQEHTPQVHFGAPMFPTKYVAAT